MDYIERAFGEKVTRKPWQKVGKLPLYFKGLYQIDYATIGGQECLLISPQGELGPISTIIKHIARLKDEWNGPVVLEVAHITRQRRQSLLAEKIPFVVPDKQLFLPFMGALLQERFDSERTVANEQLQPSAQVLLFHFIYGKNAPMYINRLPEMFGLSAMTVTRAAEQLTEAGLLNVHKDGVKKVLTCELTQKALYQKARPMLINPVRRRFFIDNAELPNGYFLAGESALAQLTMLDTPSVAVYGLAKAEKFASQTTQMIDSEKQCQIELWRYNPTVLNGEQCADALSLALSLAQLQDERVEIAIEEILEKVWG